MGEMPGYICIYVYIYLYMWHGIVRISNFEDFLDVER